MGLVRTIHLKVGVRYMIASNINIADGVNGKLLNIDTGRDEERFVNGKRL
jgi:hypothetical protein